VGLIGDRIWAGTLTVGLVVRILMTPKAIQQITVMVVKTAMITKLGILVFCI